MTLRHRPHASLVGALVAVLLWVPACGDGPGEPGLDADRLEFEPQVVDLGTAEAGTAVIRNTGSRAVGPIALAPLGIEAEGGGTIPGSALRAIPDEVPTLNPDDQAAVTLVLELQPQPTPGSYTTGVVARVADRPLAELDVRFSVPEPAGDGSTASIRILTSVAELRQGDVMQFSAETRDSANHLVADPSLRWSVWPGPAGVVDAAGRFVGYEPGSATVIAWASGLADSVTVSINPRGLSGGFTVVGHGAIAQRYTSDLWLFGAFAYTGTWGSRSGPSGTLSGNRMYAWDVSNPAAPALVDSLGVDARTVNDVKIRSDGRLAVITHEGSNDGQNGVTLVDLSTPGRPRAITRFTQGLESGVHNTWIDGNYVYLVVDGVGSGLRVLDVAVPSQPRVVASYYAGSSFLHDVYVRDGLAFLSHWDAGLVILDVGNGIAGGSPAHPIEVSRVATAGGDTHNAWYWPAAGYVFVGEEDFSSPGVMHVVDVRDLRRPREVATFAVFGDTPHNFWLDEGRGILYLAWYSNGLRALDVSGQLLGALDRQGREIATSEYSTESCFGRGTSCTWAPQLQGGLVFVSDLSTGLWALRPSF